MGYHITEFIPTNVVTAMMVDELRESLVFEGLVRTSTPANIGVGSSYKIPGVGAITVGDYTGADITVQDLSATDVSLSVDQAKYFAFYLDKVDSEQAAKDVLPVYVDKASYELANTLDTYVASTLATNAGLTNTGMGTAVSAVAIDETTVLDWAGEIKEALDTANVPQEGRYLVVPPYVAAAIAKTNIEKSSTTLESARMKGWVNEYLGMNIFMSNNLPLNSTKTTCVAGVQTAADLVLSVNDLMFMDAEKRFASLSKGLSVYGAAVSQSSAIAKAIVTKA